MADWYKEFASLGHAVIKKTRFSNAMGTPLVLVVLVTIPCLVLYGFTTFWPILFLAAFPVVYFVRAFDYIMKRNPSLLRTEEHEERMLQIQVGAMGEKEEPLPEQAIDILPPVTGTAKQPANARISALNKKGKK